MSTRFKLSFTINCFHQFSQEWKNNPRCRAVIMTSRLHVGFQTNTKNDFFVLHSKLKIKRNQNNNKKTQTTKPTKQKQYNITQNKTNEKQNIKIYIIDWMATFSLNFAILICFDQTIDDLQSSLICFNMAECFELIRIKARH